MKAKKNSYQPTAKTRYEMALRNEKRKVNLPIAVGRWFKERRKKIGSSQEVMATCSGLSRTYIQAIEREDYNVTILTFTNLVDSMGLKQELEYKRLMKILEGI